MKSIVISLLLLSGVLIAAPLVSPVLVRAQAGGICLEKENQSFLGFPTWYKYLELKEENGSCEVSLGDNEEEQAKGIGKILLAIFEILLRIAGLAAVGFVMYGGFQYLISQGEPDRTKAAKSTILNALIGVAIAISATAIVNIIGRNLS